MRFVHGGDIYHNGVDHDFSVNLNPLGCPPEVLAAMREALSRCGVYPDPEQEAVRGVLSSYLGLPPEQILCAGGASEIFSLLVGMLKPSRVLLTAPCFGGYERAVLASESSTIKRHYLLAEEGFALTERFLDELDEETDLCFLCDPNNPTGRRIEPELKAEILKRCSEKGIKLVADECFLELSEGCSTLAGETGKNEQLFVVRAFTKLLAVPGVRFGYVLACEENIRRLSAYLPEWDLSVFAEAAAVSGAGILKQGDYLKESLKRIAEERAYLGSELRSAGLEPLDSVSCFLLFRSEKELYQPLLEKRILIRDCSDFHGLGKGYYRIAVRDHKENETLVKALKEVL